MTSLDRPRAAERAQPGPPGMRPALETPTRDRRRMRTRRRRNRSGRGTNTRCSARSPCWCSCRSGKRRWTWAGSTRCSPARRAGSCAPAIEMFADGSILVDMQVSGFEFVVGYGAAIIIGVPLGILMGWYSRVDAVLDPFVSALYATPRIALLPLVMIWFGIGLMSKIAIVFLGAIFPILVNTITGVRTVNARLRQGRALVRLQRLADVPDRGAAVVGAAAADRPAARARTRAGRHRGRRDVRRHPRARLLDRDGGRTLPDRQGDGRHHHHRRRRHRHDRIAAPDRAALRTLAAECRG